LVSKRTWQIAGGVVFAVSVTLLVWQGSFTFGDYAPASIEQTYLFWAVSTLIFLLTVTLGFMLFRTAVKLYIERQRNRESTGIKTKMVVGALALSFLPVFFLVLFSISVLNRNLEKWFSRPAMNVRLELGEVSAALDDETRLRARAQARWLAGLPEIARYLETGVRDREALQEICRQEHLLEAEISYSGVRLPVCAAPPEEAATAKAVEVQVPLGAGATLAVKARMPVDLALKQEEISRHIAEYDRLTANRKATRNTYLMLLGLITLFILFVATWIALFLARQIIVPVSALLKAASQVRQGNLGYRVRVEAIDELASLVRAFNDMTRDLQANARELESRRRFIEAIVENIPTGVVSIAADGAILTVNRALSRILDPERVGNARRIEDLFPAEDASEIRYLMNRARRIGVASQQFELGQNGKERHLAVTISALEDRASSGFVVVIEDTTDLLLAQKAAAWREVARRIAHELKNPMTPITLSVERIVRQVERASRSAGPPAPEVVAALRESAAIITQEMESVRSLVDEFAQFARFPAARPAPASLNEVVESALAVFTGRLDGIELSKDLAPDLPPVNIDREQFKRVVVNLVDNSAEAMRESLTRRLYVGTRLAGPDTVELVVADTGCGVTLADKEKLFLPYFSTKGRGTGLGLAIVSHILSDHGAQIRVEDNQPVGARFVVEIPALAAAERRPAEAAAGV
jgi:two-component system nitrogen regulation sensor histidine kinase NtrY